MKRKFFLSLTCLLILVFFIYPSISKGKKIQKSNSTNSTVVYSFNEIMAELNTATQETLVIFDVDEVLITYQDMVLRPCGKQFRPSSWDDLAPEEFLDLLSIMLSESQVILVDPSMPYLIKLLQNKGVKTFALTAARTGKFGVIENAENWRLGVLKQFNIDFTATFPGVEMLYFDNVHKQESDYALYKKGVLFLGDEENNSKGALLMRFLEKVKWRPKEVIFIDDTLSHLHSVEAALKKAKIPFRGYQYKGVDMLPGEFNEQIAQRQFSCLRKKRKWLSDSEANKEKFMRNPI